MRGVRTINNYNDNRFHGKPCTRGHDGWRYRRGRQECCECVRLRVLKQRRAGKRQRKDGVEIYVSFDKGSGGEQAHGGTETVQS